MKKTKETPPAKPRYSVSRKKQPDKVKKRVTIRLYPDAITAIEATYGSVQKWADASVP